MIINLKLHPYRIHYQGDSQDAKCSTQSLAHREGTKELYPPVLYFRTSNKPKIVIIISIDRRKINLERAPEALCLITGTVADITVYCTPQMTITTQNTHTLHEFAVIKLCKKSRRKILPQKQDK